MELVAWHYAFWHVPTGLQFCPGVTQNLNAEQDES